MNNKQKKVLREFAISLILVIIAIKVATMFVHNGLQNMAKVGQERIQRMNAKQQGQSSAGKE